jgi:hypothetical protein
MQANSPDTPIAPPRPLTLRDVLRAFRALLDAPAWACGAVGAIVGLLLGWATP